MAAKIFYYALITKPISGKGPCYRINGHVFARNYSEASDILDRKYTKENQEISYLSLNEFCSGAVFEAERRESK